MIPNIYEKWSVLGIAYSGSEASVSEPDPERTIIESTLHFSADLKLLRLVHAWLEHFGDLVHIERLKVLLKNEGPTAKAWVGGLASHMAKSDRRWAIIAKTCEGSTISSTMSAFERLVLDRQGVDEKFSHYGILLPRQNAVDLLKKLRRREYILDKNFWLRLRSLFGSNWRADVASEMCRSPEQTPYRIAKTLGCNTETAYRNWKALSEARVLDLLKVS